MKLDSSGLLPLILVIISGRVTFCYGRFRPLDTELTFNQAKRACRALGASWGLPGSLHQEDLIDSCTKLGIDNIWLDVKRRIGEWKYIDNTQFVVTNTFRLRLDDTEFGCGAIDLNRDAEEALVPISCADNHACVLCKSPDINYNFEVVHNWYDGRNSCRSEDTDMSTSLDTAMIKVVIDRGLRNTLPCYHIFVGLIRENWVHRLPNGSIVELGSVPWAAGEPDVGGSTGRPCVQLRVNDRYDGRELWHILDCNQTSTVVCQNYDYDKPNELSNLVIFGSALIGALFLPILLMVLPWCHKAKANSPTSQVNRHNHASQPLMMDWTLGNSSAEGDDNEVRIALFRTSEGLQRIDHYLELEDNNISLVTNQSTRDHHTDHNIQRILNNRRNSHQHPQEAGMKIKLICIGEARAKLTEEDTKAYIKYLLRKNIDIALSPPLSFSIEALCDLRELRKKTVLVSLASEGPDRTAAETVSLGIIRSRTNNAPTDICNEMLRDEILPNATDFDPSNIARNVAVWGCIMQDVKPTVCEMKREGNCIGYTEMVARTLRRAEYSNVPVAEQVTSEIIKIVIGNTGIDKLEELGVLNITRLEGQDGGDVGKDHKWGTNAAYHYAKHIKQIDRQHVCVVDARMTLDSGWATDWELYYGLLKSITTQEHPDIITLPSGLKEKSYLGYDKIGMYIREKLYALRQTCVIITCTYRQDKGGIVDTDCPSESVLSVRYGARKEDAERLGSGGTVDFCVKTKPETDITGQTVKLEHCIDLGAIQVAAVVTRILHIVKNSELRNEYARVCSTPMMHYILTQIYHSEKAWDAVPIVDPDQEFLLSEDNVRDKVRRCLGDTSPPYWNGKNLNY